MVLRGRVLWRYRSWGGRLRHAYLFAFALEVRHPPSFALFRCALCPSDILGVMIPIFIPGFVPGSVHVFPITLSS